MDINNFRIRTEMFIDFLLMNNWKVYSTMSDSKVFQKANGEELFQVTIPLNSKLGDYDWLLSYAVEEVAKCEKISVEELVVKVKNVHCGLISFENDNISSLRNMSTLCNAIMRMVTAAALDLMGQDHISSNIQTFIDKCSLIITTSKIYVVFPDDYLSAKIVDVISETFKDLLANSYKNSNTSLLQSIKLLRPQKGESLGVTLEPSNSVGSFIDLPYESDIFSYIENIFICE